MQIVAGDELFWLSNAPQGYEALRYDLPFLVLPMVWNSHCFRLKQKYLDNNRSEMESQVINVKLICAAEAERAGKCPAKLFIAKKLERTSKKIEATTIIHRRKFINYSEFCNFIFVILK